MQAAGQLGCATPLAIGVSAARSSNRELANLVDLGTEVTERANDSLFRFQVREVDRSRRLQRCCRQPNCQLEYAAQLLAGSPVSFSTAPPGADEYSIEYESRYSNDGPRRSLDNCHPPHGLLRAGGFSRLVACCERRRLWPFVDTAPFLPGTSANDVSAHKRSEALSACFFCWA
jgi:hypothetical protein